MTDPNPLREDEMGLFQAIGAHFDARRKRRAWNLVARGIALHPPIAGELVTMTDDARAAILRLDQVRGE